VFDESFVDIVNMFQQVIGERGKTGIWYCALL